MSRSSPIGQRPRVPTDPQLGGGPEREVERTEPRAPASPPSREARSLLGVESPKTTAPPASEGQSLIAIRSSFSTPPAQLAELLKEEVKRAGAFVDEVLEGMTFFGGARITEDDPFFTTGMQWGEAIFLSNLIDSEPELGLRAVTAGIFSPDAVQAARAAAVGVAVGELGASAFSKVLGLVGGAASPEAVAFALAKLEAGRQDPDRAKVLLGIGLRPRTGAGPGIMHAVPLGYVNAQAKLLQLFPDATEKLAERFEAQGSRMEGKLPAEEEESTAIAEVARFTHFLGRRFALTERAAGFVVFPGGFGTLNEAFEAMRARRPVVFESKAFWQKPMEVLAEKWRQRDLVPPDQIDSFRVVDGVSEGLGYLLQHAETTSRSPRDRAHQLGVEAEEMLKGLAKVPPAVSFVGGRRLRPSDPEVKVAARLAGRLAKEGSPVRILRDGALLDAVGEATANAAQGFFLDQGDLATEAVGKRSALQRTVHFPEVHKLAVYENAEAIVALPGGKGTLDDIWEVACLMQTGNLSPRPIILVGREFYQPFLDACQEVMDSQTRRTVSPGEFEKWFTVVDTEEEALAALEAHRQSLSPAPAVPGAE